jgi:hypothetical protein
MKNEPKFYTKYGIELPASTRIVRVEAVENLRNFTYINSLLEKETHDWIFFFEKTCPRYPVIMGPLLTN